MAKKLPVYSICTITGVETKPEEFIISRFSQYLAERNYLLQPHGHSFYHLVFFTRGAGKQAIDFNSFPVKPGQIYFMIPGQVHSWQFSGEVDGYIVNFSESFFDSFFKEPNYLERFPFFGGYGDDQVIHLTGHWLKEVTALFERLLNELKPVKNHATEMIRTLLLQLFITVTRQIEPTRLKQLSKPGFTTLRNFQKLVNENYIPLKLPSEYAARLYVTPNYLNALCRDLLGKSAGEIIRDRIMLEAKRLLINADLSISEISSQLNFQDNSYFTKFFKKYTGKTPEDFRKDYQVGLETD
ncbi:AraC family transcriptional regulator [Terrimonas sp. NA20]|uniref:AraC family transcriptional regulator n=1 Tax=Terrimonas ginsenosidimutans TaxID=2908004 RepID=A0ABS9KKB5_9BACT|nr:helix-turn-helix transcriptional regulator [Terrimonas ginsenosidimutans]MCG2612761.1 AraC family transcriptional regulator [Terrimonas ginsenosidimutans]